MSNTYHTHIATNSSAITSASVPFDASVASNSNSIITASGMPTGASWCLPENLKFDVDGEEIEFTGKEIIRLKEMLTKFIADEHPEDLL